MLSNRSRGANTLASSSSAWVPAFAAGTTLLVFARSVCYQRVPWYIKPLSFRPNLNFLFISMTSAPASSVGP